MMDDWCCNSREAYIIQNVISEKSQTSKFQKFITSRIIKIWRNPLVRCLIRYISSTSRRHNTVPLTVARAFLLTGLRAFRSLHTHGHHIYWINVFRVVGSLLLKRTQTWLGGASAASPGLGPQQYQTYCKLWTSITPKRLTFDICWYAWLGSHIGKSL